MSHGPPPLSRSSSLLRSLPSNHHPALVKSQRGASVIKMSLTKLPVEILLLIEAHAKDGMHEGEQLNLTPSLCLSWVSQYLRAVFMPRFWSYCVVETTKHLARTEALIRDSPPDTYRHLIKYFRFGEGVHSMAPISLTYYDEYGPPGPESDFDADDVPVRGSDEAALHGPDEPWPGPMELVFNDPKRLFQLAGKKLDSEASYETDETASEAESEEERAAEDCKLCHPAMRKVYRHRVKPDDYWLPGAVHSVGPLEWNRRTWSGFCGPDARRTNETWLPSIDDFLDSMTFVMSQLNFEAFCWSSGFALPPELCECLLQHATFYKLTIRPRWIGAGCDCFSEVQGCENLVQLAPKITVLDDSFGTAYGDGKLELPYDVERNLLVILPLSDYPERNSAAGFMRFLLAATKLEHLSTDCQGVFHTPCLLGVFARLHSLHWGSSVAFDDHEHHAHVLALSKLRSCLWQLAQALDRPEHLLEASDVQCLSEATGEHPELAAVLAPLAKWLAQDEYAALVAQGWNEQEQRGPNDRPVFFPPIVKPDKKILSRHRLSDSYENPFFTRRN